jgi:signal transduction histidine kinase
VNLLRVGSWTLRRRVAALCLAVGVVLGALGLIGAVTAAGSNDHLDNLLNKTGPMRTAATNLSTAYLDQETAVRGYAISADPDNLIPYNRGRQSADDQVSQIEGVLNRGGGNATIRADLRVVEDRATQWRTVVAEPVITATQQQGAVAGQAAVEAANTGLFDNLRRSVAKLQADILVVRNETATAAMASGNTLLSIMVVAAVIIILAGAALMLLLDRLVSRPVVDLAEQVREVAGGEYDRRIASTGSPELRRLAEDVDGMRRQIAAELSQVRQARSEIEWVNDQLKTQADELTRSNRDLEQFAYVASHDLQEPLRKVASFCQLLQRRYAGQLDERADQYIAFAVDGALRMQALINDLLAFSRIGRLTSGFTDVDLNRVLTEVSSQLESRTGEDGQVSWSDLPTVEGEEPLLTTLFVNLIGNSLKFRRPDVPPVITVSAELAGQEWRINVRDNGIGIEPEFADKVFVIFQRLHARDAYEGTGIGLAIVKKIVEYHGGRIWLDLDAEVGTSINFTLPLLAGVPVKEPLTELLKEATT